MKTGAFPSTTVYDILCFSHLRWDFVFQRPQHLLSRFSKERRVFFIEEPTYHDGAASFRISERDGGVTVMLPVLPHGCDVEAELKSLLDKFVSDENIENFVTWYYTPMMLGWSDHLEPEAVVYDCMDELAAFKNAPAELREMESRLFELADLVFTGGRSLYESKKNQHSAVYCFPSSIDVKHFARAMNANSEPADQAPIANPRIGFFGVIDERTDIDLLRQAASLRPEWQFVMLGPVVKISEDDLPKAANIHYLGGKDYKVLPDYISGWDVAMMPFAINESTRFISPTKTPEYLAAGRPVVSTRITDVVAPYGEAGLVHIADTAEEFVAAIETAMNEDPEERRNKASEFLRDMSWDKTFRSMSDLICDVVSDSESEGSKVGGAVTV